MKKLNVKTIVILSVLAVVMVRWKSRGNCLRTALTATL